ncbi:MAG: hypothetical protein J6K32_12965 [Clostridia bacterium]|nr:hypothetical protein [Clostridia bacterium]
MKVTTSKGHEYEAAWAHGPLRGTQQMMMELIDGRRLSEIAAEIEECSEIRTRKGEKAGEPETVYTGYTRLAAISGGSEEGRTLITLARE